MRFLLLARARTTGRVRLLSDRAFDSRTAAVDAATVTAHLIDLGDDEVLAVDLDSAGPVLVLRVSSAPLIPSASLTLAPQSVDAFSTVSPDPGSVSGPVPHAPTTSADLFAGEEPAVRLQPRFPLFGLDDEEADEELAEKLRRVARRMELDLTGAMGIEWAPVDDTWDARTLDDYAVPDETHHRGGHEEGNLRRDAATELLHREAALPTRESFPDDGQCATHSDEALAADDAYSVPLEMPSTGDDSPWADEEPDDPDDEPDRGDTDTDSPDPSVWDAHADDAIASTPVAVQEGSGGADSLDLDPWFETHTEDVASASDLTVAAFADGLLYPEAGPDTAAAGTRIVVADEMVAVSPDDPEPEPVADAEREPEPEPYRASNTDFAIWVCSDCVYQRTCRKAGVSTPATCGNFLWKTF
jgi:hypothetical protein